MKILLTGGHGFLGYHVSKEFAKYGYTFYDGYSTMFGYPWHQKDSEIWRPGRADLDLTDLMSTRMGVGDFKPDVILHMAAVCGGILANKNSPADFLHKNVDMTSNIFHAAKEYKVKRVYTLGSVCAYPKYCPVPFKEDNIWNGYPEETNAPYGMAKRLALLMSQTYREQYGIGGAHFIPVNMYGEHDNFHPVTSHVIPALIHKFEEARILEKNVVECWGTGSATREFLYAGDTAEALVKAVLTEFDSPLPINLGIGQDISIRDLANLIGSMYEFKGDIKFTGSISDGQPKRMLDVSRAKELLGWTAGTSLEKGLRRTIKWWRNEVATAQMDAWGG